MIAQIDRLLEGKSIDLTATIAMGLLVTVVRNNIRDHNPRAMDDMIDDLARMLKRVCRVELAKGTASTLVN